MSADASGDYVLTAEDRARRAAAVQAATDPEQTEARRAEHERVKAAADVHDPDAK